MDLSHLENLALFSQSPCLNGLDFSCIYTKYRPVSSVKYLGDTISFSIQKDSKNFTDLSKSYIVMKLQIVDKTTNEPYVSSATATAAVVDNIRYSLVKSASISLNKTKIGNPEAQTWLQKYIELYTEPTDYKEKEEAVFAGSKEDDAGKYHTVSIITFFSSGPDFGMSDN